MTTVNNVLNSFSDYFGSIEVIIVAYEIDDRFENIITSITFKEDKVSETNIE